MYEEYKAKIQETLTEKRYIHSLNVADSAKALAERFGVDANKAYLAGLVHDVCKDMSNEKLLQIIEEFAILLDNVEAKEPKLWHAIAGSAYIERVFNIRDEEILRAVRYHTTARAGMTLFEKILYLADFISADREYDGVDEMRSKVEEGLAPAMLFGLQFTVVDLGTNLHGIHPDTIAAYNEIVCS